MLKYRLIFGSLMIACFVGLIVLDGWLDGSLSAETATKDVQATVLTAIVLLLAVMAQLELIGLFAKKKVYIIKPLVIASTILLATSWYWRQFFGDQGVQFHLYYLLFVSSCSLLGIFFLQGYQMGTEAVVVNCSVNFFAIFYIGLLSSFFLGIRIDFGALEVLMFIFVVKSSDIGAYATGQTFGKHKFSPNISPGKTWEGLLGAVIFACIVSLTFGRIFGIMGLCSSLLFGALFAFLGQLGDLAESMIKRDADQKDSSDSVPGFGGILDIIDSPLATAPLAYLFFMLVNSL